MAGKLTCGLGVGVGELAADDDLIRLSTVKIATGLGELAEEVADEPLGAFVQSLEVGRELDGGVCAEMRSDRDLRCSIDKKDECLTRGGDGAAEERRKIPRRCVCCWPFVRMGEKRLGFLGLEEGEGKGSSGRWKDYSADGVIYSPKWGRWIGCVRRCNLYSWV